MTTGNTEKPRILIIDDDRNMTVSLGRILEKWGYEAITAGNGEDGLSELQEKSVAVALIDLTLPDIPGTEVLEKIRSSHLSTQAIILTGNRTLESAITCMKVGACDYLVKPFDLEKLAAGIQRALEIRALNDELLAIRRSPLPDTLANEAQFASIITRNKQMRELFRYIEVIAVSRQPVLITGETGVGKELFARAIHRVSGSPGAFVAVNVAGLDELMFSDTLFGHKKGSYTGAVDVREGLVGKASDGTLFLDEIGDLSESSQIKLLRLIQEHEYYRIGSDSPMRSNARLVIATNRDLQCLMQEGSFRKDLFFRLSTHQISIPPLRERLDDLSLLLDHFVDLAAHSMGKRVPSYPNELCQLLATYEFPGNVRELQAMVFDMVARSSGRKLLMEGFNAILKKKRQESSPTSGETCQTAAGKDHAVSFTRFPTLKEAETELINRALQLAKGNQGVAASLLGITRQALNNRLRRNG